MSGRSRLRKFRELALSTPKQTDAEYGATHYVDQRWGQRMHTVT
jgi:hypothetical protein